MSRCSFCWSPGTVSLYWEPEKAACGSCAARLAGYLDEHDCWPPVELPETTSALEQVQGLGLVVRVLTVDVDRADGMLLMVFAQALDAQGIRVGPATTETLTYTGTVTEEVRAIGDQFCYLLLAAWALQGTHSLRLCEYCTTPFLLKTSQRTKCPMCGTGNRVQRVAVPFMPKPKQRTR